MTRLTGWWECYTGDTPLAVAAKHYHDKHNAAHEREVAMYGRLYLGPVPEDNTCGYSAAQ